MVGTTITGIQTAITLYTLVMATLMITGGKIGSIIGRKKAFLVGCVIYATGSLITGLAPSLPVLLFGWSFLEGVGAALIMPAVVALVASNFDAPERPKAYGLVAAAGAIAVAAGPLIGGAATTYVTWRLVFFGEVAIIAGILVLSRRLADVPVEHKPRLDLVGTALSIVGLGAAVFGVLRSSEWGWVRPKPGGPDVLGLSPTFWLIAAGALVVWAFFIWQTHLESVVLGLSAMETGVRIMPLSVALLAGAVGVPRLLPAVSPRRIFRLGLLLMLAGILVLMAGIDLDSSAGVVLLPMLILGLGIGFLSDSALEAELAEAGVADEVSDSVVAENREAAVTGSKEEEVVAAPRRGR